MADFRKVLDNDNQVVWVNRDLVNAVVYLKEEKKTVFYFSGGPDHYMAIPGACPIFSDRRTDNG